MLSNQDSQRLDALADLARTVALYMGRHTWTQLTTEQKDLLADTLDEGAAAMNVECGYEAGDELAHRPESRWWRPRALPEDFTHLRVVTPAAWLAADLANAHVLPVRHDLGLDLRVPAEVVSQVAWWAPMAFAARLIATTGQNPFLAPGPYWTADLPRRWTGRDISTVLAGDVHTVTDRHGMHVKPAEAKVASLPALAHQGLRAARAAVSASNVEMGTVLQVSDVVEYTAEYRCFTIDRDVVASSAYLVDDVTWDAWDEANLPDDTDAVAFAHRVLADPAVAVPDAMALDVGRHPDGTWSVIESNPAWSSNPYHADRAAVIAAVLAAQRSHANYSRWSWRPDPYFDVARRRPLKVSPDPNGAP